MAADRVARGDTEPFKYFLSTLPIETPLDRLVFVTKTRWRIERDYRELKQEFGLGVRKAQLARYSSSHHPVDPCLRIPASATPHTGR